MLKEAPWESDNRSALQGAEEDAIEPALVREELRRIVSSRHFQTSRRGKEFLQYVVNQKIGGKGDLLKERLIGVQIFGRKPDYSTGDDPVVRVQAGDVRRRLERYHADAELQSNVLIEIPLGSYVPVFHLRRSGQAHEASEGEATKPESAATDPSSATPPLSEGLYRPSAQQPSLDDELVATADHLSGTEGAILHLELENRSIASPSGADPTSAPRRESRRLALLSGSAILVFVCLALLVYLANSYFHKLPGSELKAFWSPATVSSKPILLCLPKPMVYKPSDKLFDRYAKSHPNAFATRESRQDQFLPLEPSDPIQWGDMVPSRSAGPGIGGVIAAITISKLLTEQNIRYELRFGDEATYAEMRDSPVVIIGGINTEWATQLTSELNFVFDQTPGAPNIHEVVGAKRVWKMESNDGNITRDYGMITRQLSGKAGQFLVQIAGCSHFGTAAASELFLDKKEFANALRSQSVGPQTKNLQIVISTDITAGRAGPPHIVAVRSW